MDVQLALGARITASHELPQGEEAKTVAAVERLWESLRLERGGTLLALGGGCTTDAAGFAAAGYMRGIDWVAVPTTLVGQVDAAIGGKTAIDLTAAKNLVGAFHWPRADDHRSRHARDAARRRARERPRRAREDGSARRGAVLGAAATRGRSPLRGLQDGVCLRDPHDRGERAQLNLGHTFAHALEAAADFELPHGKAVALGLLAALRLSGLDTRAVEETLRPEPVRVDRDRAWAALARDKKSVGGVPRLVLLERPGVRASASSSREPRFEPLSTH